MLIPHPASAPRQSQAPIYSLNNENDAPDPIIRWQAAPHPRTQGPYAPGTKSTSTHAPDHDATSLHPQENDPERVESNSLTIQPQANVPLSYPKTLYI